MVCAGNGNFYSVERDFLDKVFRMRDGDHGQKNSINTTLQIQTKAK